MQQRSSHDPTNETTEGSTRIARTREIIVETTYLLAHKNDIIQISKVI